MRIFVTGASGFIGRQLLNVSAGHELMCLSRRPNDLAAEANVPANVQALEGDLGRPERWLADVQRFAPDCCIHLAWEGLPDYSPERCQHNLALGGGLIGALARAKVGRVVMAGSCWEYGNVSGAVAESQEPVDCGLFARTKDELRATLEGIARETGIVYRWARIFFVYGPGQRASSLIPQCRTAFAAGKALDIRQPRVAQDFVYVEDVARGLLALAERDLQSGVYNIGTGAPAAVGEVANQVARQCDRELPFPDASFDSGFWADTQKMTAATGWRAQTKLGDGIARALQAFEAA
jgi:nucleoside-diphosphate-sugar epimerase